MWSFFLYTPELRFFSQTHEKMGMYPYAVSVHWASSSALQHLKEGKKNGCESMGAVWETVFSLVWDCVILPYKSHPQNIYFSVLLLNSKYSFNLFLVLHLIPITEGHLSSATEWQYELCTFFRTTVAEILRGFLTCVVQASECWVREEEMELLLFLSTLECDDIYQS